MRSTQPNQVLGGLGSSRAHVSHPALSRAAGRCTVRRHHRSHRHERHAPPPQSVRRPHAGRSTPRPGTTSIGAFIADGETALQLTQRRGAAAQARSFIAPDPCTGSCAASMHRSGGGTRELVARNASQ